MEVCILVFSKEERTKKERQNFEEEAYFEVIPELLMVSIVQKLKENSK